MPHINLAEGLQGIRSTMAFRPETAKPLNELTEALLHAPNSLPQGDRELIATLRDSIERPHCQNMSRRDACALVTTL
jgi:hypothetical protein